MRLLTKILLLTSYIPLAFIIILGTFGYILHGVASLIFAGILPAIGMISGFVGAKEIFSEFAIILLLSLLLIIISATTLYFLYKFILWVWRDTRISSYKLITYTFITITLSLTASELHGPVAEFYGSFYNTNETVDYPGEASNISDWILLIYIIPYSFLIFLYTHFRDKYLSSVK